MRLFKIWNFTYRFSALFETHHYNCVLHIRSNDDGHILRCSHVYYPQLEFEIEAPAPRFSRISWHSIFHIPPGNFAVRSCQADMRLTSERIGFPSASFSIFQRRPRTMSIALLNGGYQTCVYPQHKFAHMFTCYHHDAGDDVPPLHGTAFFSRLGLTGDDISPQYYWSIPSVLCVNRGHAPFHRWLHYFRVHLLQNFPIRS